MDFKAWLKLQEVGTGTNCIAVFSRQVMPMVRRGWFGTELDDPFKKKKKKKKHEK